jgi:hypothetical protein
MPGMAAFRQFASDRLYAALIPRLRVEGRVDGVDTAPVLSG